MTEEGRSARYLNIHCGNEEICAAQMSQVHRQIGWLGSMTPPQMVINKHHDKEDPHVKFHFYAHSPAGQVYL